MPPAPKRAVSAGAAPKKKAPAPPPRRRKERGPWPWKGILGTLLVGNLVAGVLYSPLLTIRRATIEGADEGEADLAARALKGLRGRPALRLDPLTLEGAALADGRYEAAEFRRSLLGSARLRLKKRVPVAAVVVPGEEPLLLDAGGTVYDAPGEEWKPLPRVILPAEMRVTSAALGAACDFRRLAEIAVGIRPILGERPVGIEVKSGGVLCLNIESARVRLGTGDRLEAKLSTLRRVLEQKPGIFREVKELNLMAPDRPKTIPRGIPSTSVSNPPDPEPPAPRVSQGGPR